MQKDDLISRQAAIDEANAWLLDCFNVGKPDRSCGLIRRLEDLPSAQRWIPCSERLPNHDEYIKNSGLFIVSDGNRSYSEWYDIYGKQRFGEPTMSGFRVDYAVTHWMPLPEPYKGEP